MPVLHVTGTIGMGTILKPLVCVSIAAMMKTFMQVTPAMRSTDQDSGLMEQVMFGSSHAHSMKQDGTTFNGQALPAH